MNPKKRARRIISVVLAMIVLGALLACAKKPYIDIDYRLPPTAGTLPGRTVYVKSQDLRGDTQIFNERAKEKFENFTGLFALSLASQEDQKILLGAYPVPALFETVMKKRLQQLDVKVAAEPSSEVLVLRIDINQFRINLVGQKWMADVAFEAKLIEGERTISRESVSASAQQVKIMGTAGAEEVIGEIFTDAINRLNIERLFDQAKR